MRTLLLCLMLSIPFTGARAAPPVIGHQGALSDAAGAPINGSVALTFRLFESATGGTPLWSEVHPAVAVVDGVYAVELGSQTPFPPELFDGSERFVEVHVGSETLAPRQRIAAVPYALSAARVEQSPITSIAALAGLPCNPANPAAGSLQISYAPSGAVSLACSNVYTLSVSISGGIGGAVGNAPPVTSSPAGISCSATPSDCSENFVGGTQVTLTATGNAVFTFVGWSGACTGTGACVITMNGSRSVTATFTIL